MDILDPCWVRNIFDINSIVFIYLNDYENIHEKKYELLKNDISFFRFIFYKFDNL